MRLEAITGLDEIARHGDEIDRFINAEDVDSSVYHQSAYLITFLENMASPKGWRLLLFYDAGKLTGLVALFVNNAHLELRLGLYALVKVTVKKLQFVGHAVAHRKNADLKLIYRQLNNYLVNEGPSFDLGVIEEIEIDNYMFEAFSSRRGNNLVLDTIAKRNEVIRYLDFPPSWDVYLASMSKKTRYNLKRAVRIFSETFDSGVRLEKFVTPEEVEYFLRAKDEIYADTWQARTLPDFPGRKTWGIRENSALAQTGCFKSYVLYGDGEPIAYIRGYQHKRFYYFEEIGYKQRWAGISPGTVLNYMFLNELMAETEAPHRLSFGYGENKYKQIFGNGKAEANQAYLYRHDSRIRYLLAIQRQLDALYRLLKDVFTGLKMDAYLRRMLKGKKSQSQ